MVVWALFGIIILCIYGQLLFFRVAKGFHIWGTKIQQEHYQLAKFNYGFLLVFLVFLVFVVPFLILKPEENQQPSAKNQAGPKLTAKTTEEVKTNQFPHFNITFDDYKQMYNQRVNDLMKDPINDWAISNGEKANTAKFTTDRYGFLVVMQTEPPHFVTGVIYTFNLDEAKLMIDSFRMYSVIYVFNNTMDIDEIAKFLTDIVESGEEGIEKNNIKYSIQNIGNLIAFTVHPL